MCKKTNIYQALLKFVCLTINKKKLYTRIYLNFNVLIKFIKNSTFAATLHKTQ